MTRKRRDSLQRADHATPPAQQGDERRSARRRAHDTDLQLQAVIENLPHMIFVKDAKDLAFVRFNRAGEELLGYSRDELLGKSDYDFFPEEEADFFTKKDRDVLAGTEVVDIPEEPIETREQGIRILHTKKIPLLDEQGEPAFLLGISEDITNRKRAEEELRSSETRQRALIEAIPDLIVSFDRDGDVLDFHPPDRSEREARERAPKHLTDIFPEDARKEAMRELARTLRNREQGTLRYHIGDGDEARHFEARFVASGSDEVVVIVRNITERRRAEDLQRRFVERVLMAQEEERRRIALELHDETGQSLTSVLVNLAALESAQNLDQAKEHARQIRGVAARTIEDLGRLSRGLHPHPLWDLGFEMAVRHHIQEFSVQHGLEVDLQIVGLDANNELDRSVSTALYRVVQESLTNIARHAAANALCVVINREPDVLRLVVEDDGKGFDVDRVAKTGGRGLGIYGIRERIALLDGSVELESSPKGTTLSIRVPLRDTAAG